MVKKEGPMSKDNKDHKKKDKKKAAAVAASEKGNGKSAVTAYADGAPLDGIVARPFCH